MDNILDDGESITVHPLGFLSSPKVCVPPNDSLQSSCEGDNPASQKQQKQVRPRLDQQTQLLVSPQNL